MSNYARFQVYALVHKNQAVNCLLSLVVSAHHSEIEDITPQLAQLHSPQHIPFI